MKIGWVVQFQFIVVDGFPEIVLTSAALIDLLVSFSFDRIESCVALRL